MKLLILIPSAIVLLWASKALAVPVGDNSHSSINEGVGRNLFDKRAPKCPSGARTCPGGTYKDGPTCEHVCFCKMGNHGTQCKGVCHHHPQQCGFGYYTCEASGPKKRSVIEESTTPC